MYTRSSFLNELHNIHIFQFSQICIEFFSFSSQVFLIKTTTYIYIYSLLVNGGIYTEFVTYQLVYFCLKFNNISIQKEKRKNKLFHCVQYFLLISFHLLWTLFYFLINILTLYIIIFVNDLPVYLHIIINVNNHSHFSRLIVPF